ncbi:MAG TPA: hypothetical protein ENO22_12160 [candidate division Zixibacteria bacterium]|nr:hypothetical protein [candidate division Zixibacteria bacterium]
MSKDRHQILNMLTEGKINVEQAEKLLNAIGESGGEENTSEKSVALKSPKYLRVVVNEGDQGDQVNIRIPMALLRAGIKLTSLLPDEAQSKIDGALKEKGINIDFNDINADSLEELIDAFSELYVDVESNSGEKVHIYFE